MSSNPQLAPLVEPADKLTIDEVRRYSRHLIIPDVGMSGQKRLKNAKVLVIGAGGLGSPALLYLAAAGVGTLGIAEFDEVDESNLQRQLLSARYSKTMASVETARDLVNGSFDVYTSRVAHGTNETMRLLTVVTVILGTLAVVAGVLGMNFKADLFASDNGFWWAVGGIPGSRSYR